jgi:NADPH:quinone reductase-like Zn-dependent oxidoreductase
MRAVRFDSYGGLDVLGVRDVNAPAAAPGRVVVRVRATSINPGEIAIREGALAELWPATFPSGQGSDLAGEVDAVGEGVMSFAPGDAVLGWTDERAAQAELVAVPADHLVPKPAALPWEVAGSMFVAPMAGLASVRAIAPQVGETIVVSGAAGGTGSVAVQLARRTGATVIGIASERNHDWLRSRDVVPVAYGDGQAERIRAAAGGPIDAWADCFGGGYVDLAIELGIAPQRINTLIDREAAGRVGAQLLGSSQIVSAAEIAELARLAAAGELEIPIAATYPLENVRDAYAELAQRHTHGKIVLLVRRSS